MSWAGDKKEILSKLVDLYQEIEESPNRYDASLALFREFDFFTAKLVDEDQVILGMIDIDKEFINAYFTQMSELMGEEK